MSTVGKKVRCALIGHIRTNIISWEKPAAPGIFSGTAVGAGRQYREFEALSECGEVLAAFVGHDHKNNFVGRYRNIALGFTPSAGFNVYGNRTKRGVRCIVLSEKAV